MDTLSWTWPRISGHALALIALLMGPVPAMAEGEGGSVEVVTQAEALQLLDDVIRKVHGIRDDTRYAGTLQRALENAAFSFYCIVGNTYAGFNADAVLAAHGVKQFMSEFGQFGYPEFGFGAGIAGLLRKHLSSATKLGGGGFSSWEFWTCLPDDNISGFSPVYDIRDSETPYEHPFLIQVDQDLNHAWTEGGGMLRSGLEQAQRNQNSPDPVALLNALVATMRISGLDPADPQVVRRVVMDGGLDLLDELKTLPVLNGGLGEGYRVVNTAPALLGWFLEADTPFGDMLDPLRNLYGTVTSAGDPCDYVFIPALEGLCQIAKQRSELLLALLEGLKDVPEMVGSASAVFDGVTFQYQGHSGLFLLASTFQSAARSLLHNPVTAAIARVDQAIPQMQTAYNWMENLMPVYSSGTLGMLDAADQTKALFTSATSSVTQVYNEFAPKVCDTYAASKSGTFAFAGFSVSCSGQISFKPCQIGAGAQSPLPSLSCSWSY